MSDAGRYQFCISFRAYHRAADPNTLTAILGLAPSDIALKGAESGFPELGPIPINGWFIHSSDLVDEWTASGEEHLAALVALLEPAKALFPKLEGEGWEFDFDFVYPENGDLFDEARAALAELHITERYPPRNRRTRFSI